MPALVQAKTNKQVKSKVANKDLKEFFEENLKLEENGWNRVKRVANLA